MKNIRTAILAVCIGILGSLALQAQSYNKADGIGGLASDTTGNWNSAFGYDALENNTTGDANVAFGFEALQFNTTGSSNTATGVNSLLANTTGSENTGVGYDALLLNTTGSSNTAMGDNALILNTTGSENTVTGYGSLYDNTIGGQNTASGYYALVNNTTGNNNIALGSLAGYLLPNSSSNNIDIGSYGAANDESVIRIGIEGTQTAFFAAGIRGTKTGSKNAVEVMIDSNGQLGTVNSSIRFKEDVHDMAAASDGLMKLRPVTYRYKQPYDDGSKPVDYGLIAEEVAEVYPDLVVKNSDGQIQTVQYQKLTPMLLNEVQKEHKQLEEQGKTVARQAETIQQLESQLSALPLLEKRLAALEAALPSAGPEAKSETK